ncbi:hypothetical protein C486_01159 [Natrinema gari JCM 14663]|uniref:Small CPxCG-related zinc finger protein n=2 Tax=Natrinema gari TaxID=419186 RepID=L9ZBD7_9EURY|nr:hypothetical protein C486_01159 [Natrinema gari JCM 14663]
MVVRRVSVSMPVWLECDRCGSTQTIPERTTDPTTGGTQCPECGANAYTVRWDGLAWHPEV